MTNPTTCNPSCGNENDFFFVNGVCGTIRKDFELWKRAVCIQ